MRSATSIPSLHALLAANHPPPQRFGPMLEPVVPLPVVVFAVMSSLVPMQPSRPAYLDRPQRLGILPSLGFWNRPDVWRLAGPFMGVAVGLWVLALGVLFSGAMSTLTLALFGGGGALLMLGLFERYIRRGMRQRAALLTATPALTDKDP